MAQNVHSANHGAVIQGKFLDGRPRLASVPPLALMQPQIAGMHSVQPRALQPSLRERQPIQARAVPATNAPVQIANPHINQHAAHLQGLVQAKRAQPLTANQQTTPTLNATHQSPVIQRVGNGEAFQLPANLSDFGGSSGQPLPSPVREKMESFFGTSFADVRVHVGPQASLIGALAFTHGSNLYFAQGQYNPNTPQGQQILGHELAHVVQQRAGRVHNPFGSGVAVIQDHRLEAEANRLGQRAASHQVTVQAKPATPIVLRNAGRQSFPMMVKHSLPLRGSQTASPRKPNITLVSRDAETQSSRILTGTIQGRIPNATLARASQGDPPSSPTSGVLSVNKLPRPSVLIRNSPVIQRASSFLDPAATYIGQIYGIWENENYPDKVGKLKKDECIYVGKTATGEDVGDRFLQHVATDTKMPWYKCDISSDNPDCWEYVPRQIVDLKNKTKAEVALWEAWSIKLYRDFNSPLLNKIRPIRKKKAEAAVAAGAVRKAHAPKKMDIDELTDDLYS